MSQNQCLLGYGCFHVTLQQMPYVVSVHVSTTFNSSCHEKYVLFKKSPVLLEYCDRLFSTHCCNTAVLEPGLNTSEFIGVPALSDSTWIRLSVDSG